MNPLANLKDIQGLDHISIWPLAIGWWALIVLAFLGIGLAGAFAIARKKYRSRWQYPLLKRFEEMEANLTTQDSQMTAIELEQLMRRIAIHRYSRSECAPLYGKEWLDWMSEKDPMKFDWAKSSRSLIEAPFRPPGTRFDLNSLRKTIQAAKGWVK